MRVILYGGARFGTLTKQAQHGRTACLPALPAQGASTTLHTRKPCTTPYGPVRGDKCEGITDRLLSYPVYALAGSRAWRAPPWHSDDGISMAAAWGETWESGGRRVGFAHVLLPCTIQYVPSMEGLRPSTGTFSHVVYQPYSPHVATGLPGCWSADCTRPPAVRWSYTGMVWFLTADTARTEGKQGPSACREGGR